MNEQFDNTKNYHKIEDFSSKKKRKLWVRIILKLVEILVIAAISISLAYLIVNWPALYSKFNYWYQYKKDPEKVNQSGRLPEIPDIEREGSWLIIPKINVDAPIIWTGTTDEKTMLADLDNGVVHYANTAMPGDTGNVVLTGHSSNYWWSSGKYNTVFALLDQLTLGDRATVLKDGKKYVYEVSGSEVVEPSRVSVLAPTPEPTLTLITCVPVGTNLNRFIIRSKQIEPKPKKTKKTPAQGSSSNPQLLPGR